MNPRHLTFFVATLCPVALCNTETTASYQRVDPAPTWSPLPPKQRVRSVDEFAVRTAQANVEFLLKKAQESSPRIAATIKTVRSSTNVKGAVAQGDNFKLNARIDLVKLKSELVLATPAVDVKFGGGYGQTLNLNVNSGSWDLFYYPTSDSGSLGYRTNW